MGFAEDVIKLRKRMLDAVQNGVVDANSKDTFEATLIQIMNDAEKQRQSCVAQADNLRRQAAQIDGQAQAFASVGSIVYGVLNGYVTLAERDAEERRKAEEAAKAAAEEASAEEPNDTGKKAKKK